jgi:hypothetical protein
LFEQYSKVLSNHLPIINAKFNELGILPSSYLLDWILPLYAKALNPDLVSRIWDILFIGWE